MSWGPKEVADLRTRLRLGVGEFAGLIGVDPRSVHRWEAGRAHPTGTAEAVLNGLSASLARPNGERVETVILGATAVGGLAYLLMTLLETAANSQTMRSAAGA